ncbi:hypothetical protein Dtox_3663 [Desulfofarcimen acetoxidans DSM 771]|uniref:Uncharacterized protein n=1 Tax=Desulfofarcimen acetoxidans (strain ATCC 49208 / DSM 771 / KCTC 5769 / VKM B-1644 / 5575) TaxID=485916 RepID=C8VWK8_DESAS|nr:hypothetical protein [Desulfofarcimen acetoxidans]ACV64372.1 hypothetical protein Dtox_3663 [Desulfofarcimen acetoxidans DSM 771]
MAGPSIYYWSWMKRPDVKTENGLIIKGDEIEPYHPGEHQKELLNAVQGIYDDKTAIEFVKQWGMLGFAQSAPEVEERSNQIIGAVEFTYATRKKDNQDIDFKSVHQEVLQFFNPNGGFNLTPIGEPISDIVRFAQWVRCLSEVKRLLNLYQEDFTAAAYEAKEWINNLSPEWYKVLVKVNIKILQEQYGPSHTEPGFYKYILDIILHGSQRSFSHRSERGVWIQLRTSPINNGTPTGQPIIQFDGLFRFIEYLLLVEGGPSPKRCADPKCRQLFFPTKADQEYCPPPLGVKRSRCENRHGQWMRRNGIQKPKIKKEAK